MDKEREHTKYFEPKRNIDFDEDNTPTPPQEQEKDYRWIKGTERWPNKSGSFTIRYLSNGQYDSYFIQEPSLQAKKTWDMLADKIEWWDAEAKTKAVECTECNGSKLIMRANSNYYVDCLRCRSTGLNSWVKATEPNFPDTKGYYICLVDIGDCLIEKDCYWNGSSLWNGDLSETDEVIAWRRDNSGKSKIFTTEDGVDIYEGDEYWYLDGLLIGEKKTAHGTGHLDRFKRFSTRKKAIEYVEVKIEEARSRF
jgi:hypothetical protein